MRALSWDQVPGCFRVSPPVADDDVQPIPHMNGRQVGPVHLQNHCLTWDEPLKPFLPYMEVRLNWAGSFWNGLASITSHNIRVSVSSNGRPSVNCPSCRRYSAQPSTASGCRLGVHDSPKH